MLLTPRIARFANAKSSSSLVAVVQSAQAGVRDHLSASSRARTIARCLLAKSKMGSVVVIIRDVVENESLQMSLIQHNHVIEQLSSTASYPALRRPILPRASDRGSHRCNLHRVDRSGYFIAILCVVIQDEELGIGRLGERVA
jgi:hypothetical protein